MKQKFNVAVVLPRLDDIAVNSTI